MPFCWPRVWSRRNSDYDQESPVKFVTPIMVAPAVWSVFAMQPAVLVVVVLSMIFLRLALRHCT